MKTSILLLILLYTTAILQAQNKRDYQWIIGGNSIGNGIALDFNASPVEITGKKTGIFMASSNTSMSDSSGKLLYYSNGCRIMNASAETMENGDEINPGLIQDGFCTSGGGSPLNQAVITIPSPGSDSIYFLFNLDLGYPDSDHSRVLPRNLYCQKIDMSKDSGLGAVVQKNVVAVYDSFSMGNVQACRHANGKDWWIIVPRAHSNCYFLVPVTNEGVQPAQLKCSGSVWIDPDAGGQATFSPDGKKYIRFNAWNGLNIFDFDAASGDLSNPVHVDFSNDTVNYIAGASVSPNSRYLYISARKNLYQFDLQAPDIGASRTLIATWDGYQNPYPTIFFMSALAPDGKIYISNTSSTFNLHVINKPNCPGVACQLVQHGVVLPDYNFATIPNLPHYNLLTATYDCDSISANADWVAYSGALQCFPNPAATEINIRFPQAISGQWALFDISGKNCREGSWEGDELHLDLENLPQGFYLFQLRAKGGQRYITKLMLQR